MSQWLIARSVEIMHWSPTRLETSRARADEGGGLVERQGTARQCGRHGKIEVRRDSDQVNNRSCRFDGSVAEPVGTDRTRELCYKFGTLVEGTRRRYDRSLQQSGVHTTPHI